LEQSHIDPRLARHRRVKGPEDAALRPHDLPALRIAVGIVCPSGCSIPWMNGEDATAWIGEWIDLRDDRAGRRHSNGQVLDVIRVEAWRRWQLLPGNGTASPVEHCLAT